MSMRNIGCSGYTIKAASLAKLLPKEKQEEYLSLCNSDCEATGDVEKFLHDNLPSQYPQPDSVFSLSDEADSETLEFNVLYTYFNEDDLYIKTPTEGLLALIKAEATPTFDTWTVCR